MIFKTKDSFHKRKNRLGIKSWCKSCRGTERANIYANNKDKELEYCKQYKINNPDKRRASANKFAAKNYILFRNLLNDIKNVPCFDCKKMFLSCAMDFDHRDPSIKLFNISEMQSSGKLAIMKEVSKCDVVCANCHRIRGHNRNHTKISYWNKIIYAYKDKPCMDCNFHFFPYVMDFDHRNPGEKLFHISKPSSHNKIEIIAEIMKCDVVCANCHRIRTFVKQVIS